MNPYHLSDKDLLAAHDEYFIILQTNTATEKEILIYNQISDELLNRKYTVKKVKL